VDGAAGRWASRMARSQAITARWSTWRSSSLVVMASVAMKCCTSGSGRGGHGLGFGFAVAVRGNGPHDLREGGRHRVAETHGARSAPRLVGGP
jgi:hypothetical protein